MKNYYVVFKRKGEKELSPSDYYIINSIDEKTARKEARELLKLNFFDSNIPKIARVDVIEEKNYCLECKLWNPHIDDMSPEKIAKYNLPRIKDNCSAWLCNNGTCPFTII